MVFFIKFANSWYILRFPRLNKVKKKDFVFEEKNLRKGAAWPRGEQCLKRGIVMHTMQSIKAILHGMSIFIGHTIQKIKRIVNGAIFLPGNFGWVAVN